MSEHHDTPGRGIEDRLVALRTAAAPPSDEQIAGDVRRGARAAGRRRAVRLATGSVSLAAVGAVAFVAVADQPESSAPSVAQPQPGTAQGGATQPGTTQPDRTQSGPGMAKAAPIKLVDYTGEQQPGFIVDEVPEGFVLRGVSPTVLAITRPGDATGVDDFRDKLVVMLQSQDAKFRTTDEPVRVHGGTGYLHDEPGAATTLEYMDGKHDVVVQAWNGVGLTHDQIVEFAEGISVTDAAQAGVG